MNVVGHKQCPNCKVRKPVSHFHLCRVRHDGVQDRCKPCHKERHDAWKLANADRVKRRQSEYFKRTTAKRSAACARMKQARIDDPLTFLIRSARYRSKKNGIPFDLEESDLIVPEMCPVLGIELRVCGGVMSHNSPSLDRIVPALGYIAGNVRVISYRANRIKCDATRDEIAKLLEYMDRTSG